MVEVTMPKLSDSMEEGTIVAWLVPDGSEVTVGDEVVEIETDKANMVYEAEAAGTLSIVAEPGTTLPIGAVIAHVCSADELPAAAPVSLTAAPAITATVQTITPVDTYGPSATTTQAPTRAQLTVARRMSEAKTTAPDFSVSVEVDMGAVVALRAQLRAAGTDPLPSVNDMVVLACSRVLPRHPRANASYHDDTFVLFEPVNIGIAVAADGALVVPVVANAESKSLTDIAKDTRRLAGLVREGELRPDDLAGGTFTVSNLGMFGVSSFTAVLNPPQAAILAVGAVEQRVVAEVDGIAVRPRMTLTLTCDHRILYGADAAAFLGDLRGHLEAAGTWPTS